MSVRYSVAVLALLGLAGPVLADEPWPRTRAERTDYTETSGLADVTAFLDALEARGAPIKTRVIGQSAGGRPLVLAVASRPGVDGKAAARRAGRLVVYVQANIHGGEVEGKEAALMLLRAIARNDDGAAALLDRLVLLVLPVFNVDGNEALGDGARLRPSQDGPARVGQRANGDRLDLNRDAIKAKAPETRAVLEQVVGRWDPALTFDLHTTNGTRHGYLLTYAPPLNPITDAGLTSYEREDLLPGVRAVLRRDRGWPVFDYGDAEGQGARRGWYTFGGEGRYVTNYVGLRNRLSVLSEAASFQPFRTRVEVTLGFVRAVLDALARDAERIGRLLDAADARVSAWGADPSKAPPLGVRFDLVAREGPPEPVPLETLPPDARVDHHKAPDPSTLKTTPLPVHDRFVATRTAPFPAGYLVPVEQTAVVELLERHGIAHERLAAAWSGRVRRFQISESVTTRQPWQGGDLTRLEGRFEESDAQVPAGTVLVRTAQPLGRLAFHLLGPEGLDGVAAWGLLGEFVSRPGPYPVLQVMSPASLPAGARP